jgi:D-glycero-D-manno-heptose 1,7-bisphosphate phosphatase
VSRPAVFLDRDGTLNVKPPEHEYLTSPEEFSWLPGAVHGAARLARAGYVLAVASNQRGVARGLVEPGVLTAIEAFIQRGMARYECAIAAFRYCPHEESAGCNCRKPRPGLLLDLARDLDLDLSRSWMIGDSDTDVLAGQAAGCRTVLIGPARPTCTPDLIAPSLDVASSLILGDRGSGAGTEDLHPPDRRRSPPSRLKALG